MCNWYKHDIPAWLGGTAHLSHEAYRLYHIVCQLIYMHERPITLNERGLAGAAAMSTRAFRTALKELLDAEKLVQIGHKLSNVRASFELEKVAKSREHSPKSREPSTKSREQAPNLLKTNGTAQVIPIVPSPRLEEKRLEQSKKESCRVSDETPTKPPTKIYSDEFETNFWKPFPRTAIMSKKEAWREWMRLAPEKRQAACQAIEPYRKHLKQNPTLNAVHACRFLSQERFDGILEKTAEQPKIDIRGHFV